MNIFRKTLCGKKNSIYFGQYSKRNLVHESKQIEKPWDIIISGGGMVGCALACLIGSSPVLSGKKVLLLEANEKNVYDFSSKPYSNRVSAISPNSKELFESFQAWQNMCNIRVKIVKKLQVWESCSDARIGFQHDGLKEDIAYIIENDVILSALTQKLNDLEGKVQVLSGMKAIDYDLKPAAAEDSDLVFVRLQDDRLLKTKLLIGADGINSMIRKKMNVKYVSWKYNQKGIVATLRLSEPTENVVAWQRFLPSGPVALLPLTDDLCSLVWTVSLPMCEKLLNYSDEEFVNALNIALWDESDKNELVESAVGTIKKLLSTVLPGGNNVRQLPPSILTVEKNSRAAFPLGLGHATKYVASKVALIGDAAHRVHPLAGQGVNLGFSDAKCLVDCLESSVYDGAAIGNLDYLLDYETKRQRHVVPTIAAIDGLNRLYGTDFTPFVLLRSLGVSVIDAFSPIKNQIIRYASSS